MDHNNKGLMGEEFAAPYLSVAVQTLRNWRWRRIGPPYVKMGRAIRYRVSDLDAYIEANRIETDAA